MDRNRMRSLSVVPSIMLPLCLPIRTSCSTHARHFGLHRRVQMHSSARAVEYCASTSGHPLPQRDCRIRIEGAPMQERSSAGRAAVSKTAGRGFESCRSCHLSTLCPCVSWDFSPPPHRNRVGESWESQVRKRCSWRPPTPRPSDSSAWLHRRNLYAIDIWLARPYGHHWGGIRRLVENHLRHLAGNSNKGRRPTVNVPGTAGSPL